MSGYSGLTWTERILKCCELAERARLNAEAAGTLHARERYLTIAEQWAGLAVDIERRHRDVRRDSAPRGNSSRGSERMVVEHPAHPARGLQ
jgi:hypothetical protein